jgi:hypothetical protein
MNAMAKKAAPPELTGGKGFEYEDSVGAWFLLQLLAGRQPLGPEYGIVTSVSFQTKESGWLLDDLLVVLSERGRGHSFAVSVKRHRQVTQRGFSKEFVRALWEQWLHTGSDCFEKSQDLLGLVTGQLADTVKDGWNALLQEAMTTPPARLVARLQTPGQASAVERNLFASLQCPPDLRQLGKTSENDAAEFISRVRLLHLDFREEPSSDEVSSISSCQTVLRSGDSSEAALLWRAIVGLATSLRTSGGSARLQDVIRLLRDQFRLKDYPDYEHDWVQLSRVSDEMAATVRCEIGGHTLPRIRDLEKIRAGMQKVRVFALLGESGCGKSAIAKELARDSGESRRYVWLNAEILDQPDMLSLERRLGLSNPINDVMNAIVAPQGTLVLDAVDRFSPQALTLAARLLGSLSRDDDKSPWRAVITCQPDNWQAVLGQLRAHGVLDDCFGQYVVESPRMREIDLFLGGFTGLRLPTLSLDLRPVLRNLKVLDWVVNAASNDPQVDARGWVGVSDVADWLWETWLSVGPNRHARAEALKKLGEKEGETLTSGVSIRDLSDSDRGVLSEIETSGLVRVSGERVHFTHDLLGDWARMRALLGAEGGLLDLLRKRASLPRWHRAIRLYGQRLLERGGDDAEQWRQTTAALRNESSDEVLVRDLFLEAIIFAVNADHLLDLVWPDLSADSGYLLVRLLKRFLHAATLPDPRLAALIEDGKDAGPLSSVMRVPYWPYWHAMLCLLDRHRNELTIAFHEPVSRICSLWLETTSPELEPGHPWPWRAEAARVALHMAKEVRLAKASRDYYFRDDTDKKVYEAALRAAPDLPEEVTQLALELCCRREASDEFKSRLKILDEILERKRKELPAKAPPGSPVEDRGLFLRSAEWRKREPWPDGPRDRVDDAFREVCLETSALTGMVGTRPEVAREVLLAVCIEEPKPDDPFGFSDFMLDHLGTESSPTMFPPMFFRGPFLPFLRLKPEDGLNAVLQLVNFATDRWLETQERWAAHQGEQFVPGLCRVSVPLEDKCVEWIGDQRVYGWFRNLVIGANLVASALMAVEKWLYEELESGHDISHWLKLILNQSRSVAFAGMLVEVAKKQHSLFTGPPRALLGIWQIYTWDHYVLANSDVWRMEMMSWSRSGERIFQMVRDWHTMPHRKQQLQQVAVYYLLTDEGTQKFFGESRDRWAAELATNANNETLELLIARFDPANYRASKAEDGKIYIGLEWPEHLKSKTEADLRRSEIGMEVLSFPFKCRRILNGEEALREEDLSAFWDQIQKIDALNTTQDPDVDRGRIEDAICGGMAVLLVKHQSWLADTPDKLAWCVNRLAAVLTSPPPHGSFTVPESIMSTHWSGFMAECGVAMLAESPQNKQIREIVAGSTAHYFHATTAFAMRMGCQFRREIGDDFGRMQNVAVLWAAMSLLLRRVENLQVDKTRILGWYDRLVRAFLNKAIPVSPLPWQRVETISLRLLRRIENRHRTRFWHSQVIDDRRPAEGDKAEDAGTPSQSVPKPARGRRRHMRFPGFDTGVLQAAFGWLPSLAEARDTQERHEWLSTWHELLSVSLRMIEAGKEDGEAEVSGTPYSYDLWIYEGIVRLIPQMGAEEKPERFWQPVLSLGPAAHYWVETFLRTWALNGPDAADSPTAFVAHWRPLIEFCLDSPSWSTKSRASFHLDRMYVELMGLGLGSERIGRAEFAEPLASMVDLYERWAAIWLGDWYVLEHFAAFLTRPGARDLVCPAIQWIRKAVAEYGDYDWRGFREGEIESRVAEVLWTCWSQHRVALQNVRPLRDGFLELLAILANRLCPSAMELRDEVSRSLAR